MKFTKSPHAAHIPFEDVSFSSTITQDAIVEAKNTAVSLPRFTIVTTFNGTIGNGQWLGYDNLLPGDTIPIVIPVKSILKEITFSYAGSNIDGRYDLYKNGTAGGNIVFNQQFTNANSPTVATSVNLSLLAGDTIRGRWVDQGDNPNDLAIVYVFQADP